MSSLELLPATTALVVIDLQRGIAVMPTVPYNAAQVVANAARLADAFRQHALPVFLVHVTPSRDMKDALQPVADAPTPFNSQRPPDWADFVPELHPQESDFLLTKRQWGAFTGTELDLQCRRRGVNTIVLCGISTDIGVESTARFAYEYGYHQIFAEDAMAARSADGHNHAVKEIFPRIGRVRMTAEIIEGLC
ncbi:MAG: hydrolase [Bacteroidota bacterium]